jgi:outer membrane protein assembly factor BamB
MALIIYSLPFATTAWVLWLLVSKSLSWPVRRLILYAVILLAWCWPPLIRFEGTTGTLTANFEYRWSPTSEDLFLSHRTSSPAPASTSGTASALKLSPGDWPGFRGPARDGRLTGVRIAADWNEHAPRFVWQQRIGPGWSSFAVVGNRLYTQEQRNRDEVVVCYDAANGTELWVHADKTRFSESMGGVGPRATPTFHEGKIYSLGANGRLNCLDAATGKVIWSRDIVEDSGAKVPTWGFSASPLVAHGIVSVFAGGEGKSVVAYHALTGEPAWSAGEGKLSYCSLHPVRVDGVDQLVIATEQGLTAFQPEHGDILWQYHWLIEGGAARVVQPTVVGDADFLIGTSFGAGTKRVHVRHEAKDWTTQEVWSTRAIKPYFNDLVVDREHFYGFDNNFLTCVSLADGKGKWKERGYGNGQILLLADQHLLLVLSETGDAALVEANPDGRKELCRFHALEGKTWNHPVVAHGKLFVRNAEKAACYELNEEVPRADAR